MKIEIITIIWLMALLVACEDNPRARDNENGGHPEGSAIGEKDPNSTGDCDTLIEMTIRDFNESHPDFEREHMGWGPATGIVDVTLGDDRKPIFLQTIGEHQMVQDEVQKQSYTFTLSDGVDPNNPMFDGAESFYDWYRNSDRNQMFEKTLALKELAESPGTYYFESLEEPFRNYFPLLPHEGFGPGPEDSSVNPHEQNFLFTTEIHLRFGYMEGQVFKFSGDDDLWIFVNGKLALDMGGLHSRFNASIDFDAQAGELGITPGNTYHMDIFHAERHTRESNFRIETNISCFEPVIVV